MRALDCIDLPAASAAETWAVLSGARVDGGARGRTFRKAFGRSADAGGDAPLRRTCLADVANVAGDVSQIGMSVNEAIERNRPRHREEYDRLEPSRRSLGS